MHIYECPQMSLAFQEAKEIGENYTRFPPETDLYAIEFLIVSLSHGLGISQNFEEAYLWFKRLLHLMAGNEDSIEFNEEFVANLRKQLSPQQIKETERRAAILYLPAKQYSEMDETNACAQFFH